MKVVLMDLAIKRNGLKAIHDDKADDRALFNKLQSKELQRKKQPCFSTGLVIFSEQTVFICD